MPAGETQGGAQVRVKLAVFRLPGAIASVKTALTAVLAGTLINGPGLVVAGTVKETRGRVVSEVIPVVKRQV